MCAKNTDAVKSRTDVVEDDAIVQGLSADKDPSSEMPENNQGNEAQDILRKSIDSQVTQLGKNTAKQLAKQKKYKVVIPKDKLNPKDNFVVVGINGWNFQIMRDTPVLVPEAVYTLLVEGGYGPTVIP